MSPQLKKHKEQFEAFQASLKLGEEWELEHREAPDFMVTSAGHRFGLEVTHCHVGPKFRRSSLEREKESANHNWLTAIRSRYEARHATGLDVRYRGEVSAEAAEELFQRLIDARFETRSIFDPLDRMELTSGTAHVRRTPNTCWMMLDDGVGWISRDGSYLQREIDLKAKKLANYRKACTDIRLLVVANRIYNSGKLQLEDGFRPDLRGFDAVYFFSYPISVTPFYNPKQ